MEELNKNKAIELFKESLKHDDTDRRLFGVIHQYNSYMWQVECFSPYPYIRIDNTDNISKIIVWSTLSKKSHEFKLTYDEYEDLKTLYFGGKESRKEIEVDRNIYWKKHSHILTKI